MPNSDKTEEATPHALQKAREEGNVAKSRELTAGVMLFVIAIFFYFYMPYMVSISKEAFNTFFQFHKISDLAIDFQSIRLIFFYSLVTVGKLLLPMFIILFVIAFLIEAAQVGLMVTVKAIEPKWERINFFAGLPKFFSIKKKGVELFKSIFKIIVLGYIGLFIVRKKMDIILRMTDAEYIDNYVFLGLLLFEIVFKISLAVILLGIIDLLYQKWNRRSELKMSKQQLKEEYKQMEGDPLIKQKIRETQREMARARMLEDAAGADAVITNPTHYAVAIKYDEQRPPFIVAKGQRLMALKIREIAKENNIYIHEDPPLAQTMFKTLEIGDEIPENLYSAIAEILAIVFRKRDRKF